VRVLNCSASTNLEITEGPRCQSRLHRKKECFIILLFPRHYTQCSFALAPLGFLKSPFNLNSLLPRQEIMGFVGRREESQRNSSSGCVDCRLQQKSCRSLLRPSRAASASGASSSAASAPHFAALLQLLTASQSQSLVLGSHAAQIRGNIITAKDFLRSQSKPCVSASYKIAFVSAMHAGSTHDSTTFLSTSLHAHLLKKDEEGGLPSCTRVAADNAYGNGIAGGRFVPTLYAGRLTQRQDSFNYYLSSLRIFVEQVFGVFFSRFGVL
jgi:hypothetical protein